MILTKILEAAVIIFADIFEEEHIAVEHFITVENGSEIKVSVDAFSTISVASANLN